MILAYVEVNLNLAIYSFMAWFLLPVGAGAAGFAGATGYFAGAKFFGVFGESCG